MRENWTRERYEEEIADKDNFIANLENSITNRLNAAIKELFLQKLTIDPTWYAITYSIDEITDIQVNVVRYKEDHYEIGNVSFPYKPGESTVWFPRSNGETTCYRCRECGYRTNVKTRFCPDCGAKAVEVDE